MPLPPLVLERIAVPSVEPPHASELVDLPEDVKLGCVLRWPVGDWRSGKQQYRGFRAGGARKSLRCLCSLRCWVLQ